MPRSPSSGGLEGCCAVALVDVASRMSEKSNARLVGRGFISTALAFSATRSNRAVALLIFLPRPARAWIVAADLGLAADDGLGFAGLFAGRGGAFVGARESQRTTRPSFLAQS